MFFFSENDRGWLNVCVWWDLGGGVWGVHTQVFGFCFYNFGYVALFKSLFFTIFFLLSTAFLIAGFEITSFWLRKKCSKLTLSFRELVIFTQTDKSFYAS